MNLDDLKDQLRDQANALFSRVQETSWYNSAKDQYLSLPATAQKAIAFGSGILAVVIVLMIPISYIQSADVSIEEFNENRTLLRDLMKVGRSGKEPPPLPPAIGYSDLEAQARGALTEFNLTPEQVEPSSQLNDRPAGSIVPSLISQVGLALHLKKLNLNQVVDIGYRLQSLSSGIKLMGVDIVANAEDNHYFDTVYRLVSFALPITPEEPEKPSERKPKTGGDEE